MLSLVLSHRSLRVFAVLAIFVLCLFTFHHYGIVEDIGHQTFGFKKASHSSLAPAHFGVEQLVKRVAIPFGDPSDNVSSSIANEPLKHADLVPRAGPVTVTYEQAICRGERLRDMIERATTDKQTYTPAEFESNGWLDLDFYPYTFPEAVQNAFRGYSIPNNLNDMQRKYYSQLLDSKNSQGQTVFAQGTYENYFNVKGNAIVAVNNHGPAALAKQDDPSLNAAQIARSVPALNRWSDFVWALWKDLAGDKASSLQYIFRDNVDNGDTKYIMEQVASTQDAPVSSGNLHMPFPGKTYSVNDKEGAALLGTPHGSGTAWLMIDHGRELGGRDIRITVYTGTDNGQNKYFLVYEMLIPH